MENLPTINATVPSHVPQELIKEFNHMASPGMLPEPGGCPYKVMQTLHQGPFSIRRRLDAC